MSIILIHYINKILLVIVFFILIAGVLNFTFFENKARSNIIVSIERPPAPSTSYTPKEYSELNPSVLSLNLSPIKMRLPDLRNILFYYGHNLRPDAKDSGLLFFSLGSTNPIFSAYPHEKIFLISEDSQFFSLSPNNSPTSLWFEAELRKEGAYIQVRMRDNQSDILGEPSDRANFILAEKPSTEIKPFKLSHWTVDPSLFVKQKAKWLGKDQFLEDHGGEEFAWTFGKQKIQFGEGEDSYEIYIDKGSYMIWKDEKWMVPELGVNTTDYPLALVAKLEDRIMGFELFDVSGRKKINLNLIRHHDPNINLESLANDFQYIGSRTKVHSMFMVGDKREIVGPDDWFLLTPDGWKKLKTTKEIDSYVSGQSKGALLVIEGVERNNEFQWLSAKVYSPSRASFEKINIPMRADSKNLELIKAIPSG